MDFKRFIDSGGLTRHQQAIATLIEIKFLDFLRERSRPQIEGIHGDTQSLATQAARTFGYLECLEDLTRFKEKFLTDFEEKPKVPLDYGGSKAAIAEGYLTPEEILKLKKDDI